MWKLKTFTGEDRNKDLVKFANAKGLDSFTILETQTQSTILYSAQVAQEFKETIIEGFCDK